MLEGAPATWRRALAVGAIWLMTRDAVEAGRLEAVRRGDLLGRAIGAAAMAWFWVPAMFVMLARNDPRADLGIWAASGLLFAALLCLFPPRTTPEASAALRAGFDDPDVPPRPFAVAMSLGLPFLGLCAAVWVASTGAGHLATVLPFAVAAGAMPLRRPVGWRMTTKMAGLALLFVAAFAP